MKILYIAGMPHSGATILGNALGELDGFFCAGELFFLERVLPDGRCGCGAPVGECPVWSAVIGSGANRLDLEALKARERHYRARSLPVATLAGAAGLRRADTASYVEALGDLYARVQKTTGCRVVVDTSHSPTYARLLGTIPGVELYLVHLVRNPHATAFSWLRSNEGCDDHPLLLGTIWNVWNSLTPLAGRAAVGSCLIRYEEFVEEPQAVIRHLVSFVGETADRLPFASERELSLGTNHCVFGNSNRFRTGLVPIKLDEAWKSESPARLGLFNDIVTWPVRRRYGYGSFRPAA